MVTVNCNWTNKIDISGLFSAAHLYMKVTTSMKTNISKPKKYLEFGNLKMIFLAHDHHLNFVSIKDQFPKLS